MNQIISMRMFASFADCLRDAEMHGYQQGEHLSEFDRRVERKLIPSSVRGGPQRL